MLSTHGAEMFSSQIIWRKCYTHKQISHYGISYSGIAHHLPKKKKNIWTYCLPCLATIHKTNIILCFKVFLQTQIYFFRVETIWGTTVFLSSSLETVISTSVKLPVEFYFWEQENNVISLSAPGWCELWLSEKWSFMIIH